MSSGAFTPAFVAGDWGTSHLRLYLCDASGGVLDRRAGPGVAAVRGDFPGVLAAAAGDWLAHGPLPVVLCGMVGSNLGWMNVPYLRCPLPLERLAAGAARAADRVTIAPGLSCVNLHGAPDVLRGEETQVLGALTLEPGLRIGRHLLCLPGTHTKWVLVEDGVVREFLTSVTGELFALIRGQSVLLRAPAAAADAPPVEHEAFDRAVAHVAGLPQASILHLLFEVRSRQLSGEFATPAATAYCSGLLIAEEVRAAIAEFGPQRAPAARAVLIGDPALTTLYTTALAAHRLDCAAVDGAAASLAGLTSLHAQLSEG